MKYNTLELFAGCGGLLDGFKKSNLYNTLACVEWQKEQCKVLRERLENKYGYQDTEKRVLRFDIQRTEELIKGWKDDEYGESEGLIKIIGCQRVDIITGGPPCQAYSMAGRIQDKDGMKYDYRNYLFESYLKIVNQFRPKLFVFENVEGILSAKPDGLNIMEKIKADFSDIGYELVEDVRKYALINFAEYGIPQRRNRVILIGLNKNVFNNPQEILKEFYTNILPKYKEKLHTVKDAIGDLTKLFPIENETQEYKKKYSHSPISTEYAQHIPRFHNKRDIEIFQNLAHDIETGQNQYVSTEALRELYTKRTGKQSNVHKYNVLRWDQPSNTIPAHLKKDGLRHIHPDSQQARSITVREAARLQTFDDDFIFSGVMSKDYEMIGNAVPPKFGHVLGLAVDELLKKVLNSNLLDSRQ